MLALPAALHYSNEQSEQKKIDKKFEHTGEFGSLNVMIPTPSFTSVWIRSPFKAFVVLRYFVCSGCLQAVRIHRVGNNIVYLLLLATSTS